MKRFLLPTFVSIAAFCLDTPLASAEKTPPNIVFIVSDDQGYNDLGILLPELKTPNLDRLANEGVRLTSFYVAWPACTPSRAAFLTGRYPQRNGVYDMIRNEAPDYGYKYSPAEYEVTFERIGGMDTREIILPQYLKSAGYTSGIFGKWDLGTLKRFLPLQKGFDDFYGIVNTGVDFYTHERYGVPSMYRNNELTEEDKGTYCTWLFEREAMRFLNENHENPFFLYLPFNAPHGASSLDPKIRGAAQAPKEYRDLYPIEGPRYEPGAITKYSPVSEYFGEQERLTKPARLQEYRACVTAMDKSIGSVLDFLDEKNLTDNTIVIFFSDNGGSGGADNGPLRGKKGDTFEGGTRVISLVRWPDQIPAGSVSGEFLTSLEILPFLLNAAGLPIESRNGKNFVKSKSSVTRIDGFDMLPVLKGDAESQRKDMFWKRKDSLGARVGPWKYVVMNGNEYLFNLEDDLGEQNNLATEKPEVLARLKKNFAAWLKEMNAAEPRGPFEDF
ncbi:MAG: sulfatase-like hydrolase/transferase [Verrucomicrobiota bacterium]